jgi:rhomboid family protein
MLPQMWTTGRPVAVRVIIAILGGWGAAQATLWAFGLPSVWQILALDTAAIGAGEYWRLFTSQLLHANVVHLLANLTVLFFAGREVEPIIGRKPFVGLCLTAGLLGNLANCFLFPEVAACGFSAAVAAVVVCYATILPEFEHQLWLGLPLPGRLRAKHFTSFLLLAATICLLSKSALVIGPGAIFVGCILGWIWARQLGFGNPFWFQRWRNERRREELRRIRLTAEDFLEQEIDPILEKISRQGIGSLSRAERRTLEEGRGKLARKENGKE